MTFESGSKHPKWKGGKTRHNHGYIRFSAGPRRNKLEHRVVIENLDCEGPCHLVRPLDAGIEIHHIDWNRTHNCPGNLLVLDTVIHEAITTLHAARVRWGQHSRKK